MLQSYLFYFALDETYLFTFTLHSISDMEKKNSLACEFPELPMYIQVGHEVAMCEVLLNMLQWL